MRELIEVELSNRVLPFKDYLKLCSLTTDGYINIIYNKSSNNVTIPKRYGYMYLSSLEVVEVCSRLDKVLTSFNGIVSSKYNINYDNMNKFIMAILLKILPGVETYEEWIIFEHTFLFELGIKIGMQDNV